MRFPMKSGLSAFVMLVVMLALTSRPLATADGQAGHAGRAGSLPAAAPAEPGRFGAKSSPVAVSAAASARSSDAAGAGEPVTRAEFAAMLNEALGYEPLDKPSPFPDVPDSHPARAHLAAAREIGYMRGNAAGEAEPDRAVTRQEAAVMLGSLPEFVQARLRMTIHFADANAIAGWARPDVSRIAGSGILPVDAEGRFRPNDPLTRGEAAAAFETVNRLLAEFSRPMPRLKVGESGRHLTTEDGEPFFWLGDTAWELTGRLTRDEIQTYLASAARHGFNVVQFVLITELGRLSEPNPYGDFPLVDKDPDRPAVTPGNDPASPDEYDYWDHVDFALDTAESYGLYAALLPAWGSYLWENVGQRADPFFNRDNARRYGKWLGERYGGRSNVVWVLGGDRVPDTEEKKAIIRSMAQGLKEGGAEQLITYHPWGGVSSSDYFRNEDWIDFHAFQSGHNEKDGANYLLAENDYSLTPAKPTLDLEPRYEAAPVDYDPANGRFDAYDIRQAAYWSVFAGSFGHTYGHHGIWQMYAPGREPSIYAEIYWKDALDAPGRASMKWLRALFETYPPEGSVPDPSLVSGPRTGPSRITALRGSDFVLVYTSAGRPVTVLLDRIEGTPERISWYDPKSGALTDAGAVRAGAARQTFTPPSAGRGEDWVLIMDIRRNL